MSRPDTYFGRSSDAARTEVPVPAGANSVEPLTAAEWSHHVVDPGDSHDKGEVSLCVGEAA